MREHRLGPWLAVAAVCFGAFMGQLDASVVTVAFPAMQRQFGAGLAAVQWVSLGYLLALIRAAGAGGGVRLGRAQADVPVRVRALRRRIGGLRARAVARALIGLRLVQAAGAALLQANSVALVTTSVPAHARRAALGVQAAAQAVGLAVGPVTGGLLVGAAGWRWVFFVNVPLAVLAVAAGVLLLPRTRRLPRLEQAPAPTRPTWPTRPTRPARPAGTPTSRRRAGTVTGLLGAVRVPGAVRPAGIVPAGHRGQGRERGSGRAAADGAAGGFGLAAAADRLLPAAWPNSRRCLLGGTLAACSAAALAVPAPGAVTVVLLGLLGAGLGLYTPANNADIMAAVPPGAAGAAGGLVNMTRGIGTALGVGVVTLALHAACPASSVGGPALTMTVLAAVALAATWAGQHGAARLPARLTRPRSRTRHSSAMSQPTRPRTAELLDLAPHPEGGWYREDLERAGPVRAAGGLPRGARGRDRRSYFLLAPGEESALAPGPVGRGLAGGTRGLPRSPSARRRRRPEPAGWPARVTLGPDLAAGHEPQHVIPGGHWQAARPVAGREVLVSCVVAPGFDFADFTLLRA